MGAVWHFTLKWCCIVLLRMQLKLCLQYVLIALGFGRMCDEAKSSRWERLLHS